MTSFGPGVVGNPDWQPNDRFSGGVLVMGDTQTGVPFFTYGPFYVGDSLCIGLLNDVTPSGTGFIVAISWWADAAATQLIGTQQYGGEKAASVYDFIGNLGPYVTVTITAQGLAATVDETMTMWKTQSYPGTALPLSSSVALISAATPVNAHSTVDLFATIITRAPMAYYFNGEGGADSIISASTCDVPGPGAPILQTAQIDAYGNAYAYGDIQGSTSQIKVVMTNNGAGPVDMTASLVLL